jgi:hypothetical protein
MKLKIEKYQFGSDLDYTISRANQTLGELHAAGVNVVSATVLVEPSSSTSSRIAKPINKDYFLLVTS